MPSGDEEEPGGVDERFLFSAVHFVHDDPSPTLRDMSKRTYVEVPVRRRPVVFLAEKVKTPPFSEAARKEAGALLALVQEGEDVRFPSSRPLPAVGPRCHELRVQD